MNTNEILKLLRNQKKLTQKEMAAQLGISESSYQKYERDKGCVMPSLEVLIKLAEFHCVTTDYLLGRDNTLDAIAHLSSSELEKKMMSGYFSLPPEKRAVFLETLLSIFQSSGASEGESLEQAPKKGIRFDPSKLEPIPETRLEWAVPTEENTRAIASEKVDSMKLKDPPTDEQLSQFEVIPFDEI